MTQRARAATVAVLPATAISLAASRDQGMSEPDEMLRWLSSFMLTMALIVFIDSNRVDILRGTDCPAEQP